MDINNDGLQDVHFLKPFKHFCMTIGAIPSSYLESMTYYEMLLWFCNYLQNTVIPTIDNNAECITELQNNFIEFTNTTNENYNNFTQNITTLYNELKNYVDNYFTNLDVQTEIDNKLDEMAQSGELTSILSSFLNIERSYTTVENMKNDLTLLNNSICKTLGYYSANDNGGALYLISNKQISEKFNSSIKLNNNLYANLIIKPTFNIKQLGFIENAPASDITNFLNACFNDYQNSTIIFDNLNFETNNNISLKSNINLYFNNCNITNISTTNKIYLFNISKCSNVNIKGKNTTLKFNKQETTQQTCINIKNSNNIIIENLSLLQAGGDGITLEGTSNDVISENIIIKNCFIDNNRRNGISLIGGVKNVKILNNKITNTSGANPQYAIDLEPWQDEIYNDTIFIKNNYFSSNTGGAIDIMPYNKNIFIENNTFDDNGLSSVIDYNKGSNAYPKNCIIKNNIFNSSSIYIRGSRYSEFDIIDNMIDDGNIYFDNDVNSPGNSSPNDNGKINIINNLIKNANGVSIYFQSVSNGIIKNNIVLNSTTSVLIISGSNNILCNNNIFNRFALGETKPNNVVNLQTSKNLSINDNIFISSIDDTSINNLFRTAANVSQCKITNNNGINANYTNFFTNDGSNNDVLCINNLSKTCLNYSQNALPTASEKYVGVIINIPYQDKFIPYICTMVEGSYQWKQLINVQ